MKYFPSLLLCSIFVFKQIMITNAELKLQYLSSSIHIIIPISIKLGEAKHDDFSISSSTASLAPKEINFIFNVDHRCSLVPITCCDKELCVISASFLTQLLVGHSVVMGFFSPLTTLPAHFSFAYVILEHCCALSQVRVCCVKLSPYYSTIDAS